MTLTDAQLQEIKERMETAEQMHTDWHFSPSLESRSIIWIHHHYDSRRVVEMLNHVLEDCRVLLDALAESHQREQRAVEALRAQLGEGWCYICDARWRILEKESHNPITLSGITGPCPADLRKEQT